MDPSVAPFYQIGGFASLWQRFRDERENRTFVPAKCEPVATLLGENESEFPFKAAKCGENESQRVLSTEMFLEPLMHDNWKMSWGSLLISNLPPIRIQDTQEICDFIAKCANVCVQNLFFLMPSDKSGFPAAICICKNLAQATECLEKVHGQVFRGHHLLVERELFCADRISRHCIKVLNLSTTVTEDALWNFFENCGQLGMIYLNRGTHEAFVNFEDSDSVLNALKLDGTTLHGSSTKVVNLDRTLSVKIHPIDELNLESILRDLNVAHVEYVQKKHMIIYLSDEESFTAACRLDREEVSTVTPQYGHFLYSENSSEIRLREMRETFGWKIASLHPRNSKFRVLSFKSKREADNALKASPVLIGDKFLTLYENCSEIPLSKAKEETESAVSKPSGVNMAQKQVQQVKKKLSIKKLKKKGQEARSVVLEPSGGNQAREVDRKEKKLENMKKKVMRLTEALGADSVKIPNKNMTKKERNRAWEMMRILKKTGGSVVLEPSGGNQAQEVDRKEKIMKELEKMKKKMMRLTKALRILNKTGGKKSKCGSRTCRSQKLKQ